VDLHDVQTEHELQALQLGKVVVQSAHAVVDDEQYPELHAMQVVAFAFVQLPQLLTTQAAPDSINRWQKQMIRIMIRV
jgi:hypothetical protein